MIDKIYYKSDRELVLIFTDRPPFILSRDAGHVLDFYAWVLSETMLTLPEYDRALQTQTEDTCTIFVAA